MDRAFPVGVDRKTGEPVPDQAPKDEQVNGALRLEEEPMGLGPETRGDGRSQDEAGAEQKRPPVRFLTTQGVPVR